MKMHHNSKNGQKSAKISKKYEKKIDFPYNNFPKKDISLRKCTHFFFAFGEKKLKIFFAPAALYRCDPGGGVLYNFWILGF